MNKYGERKKREKSELIIFYKFKNTETVDNNKQLILHYSLISVSVTSYL